MHRIFFLLALSLLAQSALAFQFADGTPTIAPAGSKYIFYWGQHQCDFTEASGYKGNLSLSPVGFRQMLLHTPTIWDGARLIRDFTFTLEGQRISTENYTSRLGDWDVLFGAKATFGNTFHATNLPLGNGIAASVDILIINPDEKEDFKPARGNWASNAPFLNSNLLEQVVWGREDITKISDRDFFTVSEFWQTVRQQPFVDWKISVPPQTLRAGINFQSPEQGSFGVFAVLPEYDEYRQMLDNLYNYKHLARPGATVSFILQTAERYEELYKKQMTLVADNDPRLLLRRSRDTHILTIEWGHFKTALEGLYLTTFTDSTGKVAPIDEPIARIISISNIDTIITETLAARPRCLVDGEPVPGLSFSLSASKYSYKLSDDMPLSKEMAAEIVDREKGRIEFQLDSFALSGYVLPQMSLYIQFLSFTNELLVRNDFETLMKTATDQSVVLLPPPIVTKDSIEITFNLPKEAIAKISLFGPEGLLDHLISDKFSAGQSKVSIARSKTRFEGKHYVFLNTPFGVLKQEIELK